MELRIVDEADMTASLDAAIREALCACFPKDRAAFSRTRAWHGIAPVFSETLEAGREVVAHAGVVDRTVRAGDRQVRVAGVQNVCVLPGHRGRGLFRRVMAAAMEQAAARGFDCGLLFCDRGIEKLYARLGWRTSHGRRVARTDESGCDVPLPAGNIAMCYPLKRGDLPPGDIHLQGNDW